MDKKLPQLCASHLCTGCGACDNSCPVGAIAMNFMEGFKHPQIDTKKCIGCLACEKVCPILHPICSAAYEEPIVYAARNKDENIREESSSGGAFSALATAVLTQGGCVAGAAYDEEMVVNHILIDSLEQLPKLRSSKYVQCCINDNYKNVKAKLRQGIVVLFVGTPCQVSGLRSFLKKDYDNLYCCDFICHGVPSPLLFADYLKWLESNYDCKVSSFNFRSKRSGWYDALRVVNGEIVAKGRNDAYFLGFNRNITLRESGYRCPSIGVPRKGDITIADYWGIGRKYKYESMKEIEKGVSLVMVNNGKGARLTELAMPYMNCEKRIFEEALAGNKPMVTPSFRPVARDMFYIDRERFDFEELVKKYFELSGKSKCVAWLRENAPYDLVVGIRSLSQYITYRKNGGKSL